MCGFILCAVTCTRVIMPETDFPEVKSAEQRAEEKFESLDGLPDDNPFADVVKSLRKEGESWREIFNALDSLHQTLEPVGYEANLQMAPEWEVTVVTEMSGGDDITDTKTVFAPTADVAEDRIDTDKPEVIDSSQTKQVGVGKY